MKKAIALFTVLSLYLNLAVAQDTTSNKTDSQKLLRLVGISYVPSNSWGVNSIIGQEQWLKYKFSATALTTYEANYSIKKFPLKLGVNAEFENNLIGKAYRFAGYVGIKRIMIRIQTGLIKGTATWTGTPIDGAITEFPFNNRYTNIDLLLLPKKEKSGIQYYGIGYTSLKLPIQVNTLITSGGKENQKYGNAVFDSLYTIKAYSFMFGFDLITSEAMNPGSFKGGFGAFAATQDKVGLGMCYMTKEAVERAELVNPGRTAVTSSLFSALVEYNLSAGIKYSHRMGKGIIIAAAGYDFGGAMVANFSGAAVTSTDLGFDPSLFYWHHGFLVRIFAAW
ncbi:MAG TPA: hypothetical protein VMV56_06240 [Williamwhitmania sp.]|nr:hypothetical protein [Williamwhitmania sp.]